MNLQFLVKYNSCHWSHKLMLVVTSMMLIVHCTTESPAKIESGKRKEPRVVWHTVNSAGPGWIDFHFKIDHLDIKQLTIEIKYYKLQYHPYDIQENVPEHRKIIHVDFIGFPEFRMPTYPCPVWLEKGLYCVLLTDYIRPDPGGNVMFSDYAIEINVHRGILKEDTNFNNIRMPEGYRTIVRVWEDCDPTISSCPKLWHFARGKWSFGTESPMDEAHDITNYTTETTLPPATKVPTIVRVRKLWPLFLVLFLIVLFVFLPWFYFTMRRRTKQKVMDTWYCWTSPDGTSFLMTIPDVAQKKRVMSKVRPKGRTRSARRKKCKRSCGRRRSAQT